MDAVLPIVTLLGDCQTDAARADWLRTVPLGIVHREYRVIRILLDIAEFQAGLDYLAAAFAFTSATRQPDGSMPDGVLRSLKVASLALDEATKRGMDV